MRFHIVTLFPEMCEAYLDASILSRARKKKVISVYVYNPRDYSPDTKHRRADDRPYGGGPGMVLQAEPVVKAVEAARRRIGRFSKSKSKTILFSPDAKQFDGGAAKSFSKRYTDIILIAGHYEGVDARVKKILKAEELSIGPYVLTGGELPALAVLDAISRHVPGVLGKEESLEDSRVSTSEVYTRPEVFVHKGRSYRVPKVLLSGDHKKIDEWKRGRQPQGNAVFKTTPGRLPKS